MRRPLGCDRRARRGDRVDDPGVDGLAVDGGGVLDDALQAGGKAEGDASVELLVGGGRRLGAGLDDPQLGVAIGDDHLDGAIDELGPDLRRRLLGEIHRREPQRGVQ